MTATRHYTDDDRRHFLRYTRTQLWPLLQRFPIGDDLHRELLAQMLSSTADHIAAMQRSLGDETRATAARLMGDPGFRAAVAGLPFGPDDRIVAVGDSITADRLGWFDLLAAAVDLAGGPGPTLINLGLSGNTTADVLERFDLLEEAKPSRVLLMLGTNDARVHGRTGGYRMCSPEETARNLRALIDLITRDLGAAVTVTTPPAVDQRRIDDSFRDAPLHWQAAAIAEIAEGIRALDPGAIDLHAGTAARDDLLEADGVHPNRAGQEFILRRVLAGLTG